MKAFSLSRYVSIFLIVISGNLKAQTTLKGVVCEEGSLVKLSNVVVINLSNKQRELSDRLGEFTIQASINDLLVFSCIGYTPDTLVLTNLQPQTRYLKAEGVSLKEVLISSSVFNPERDYPEAYTRGKYVHSYSGGGLSFSPSRLFGRKGKNARRLKRMLEKARTDMRIDKLFSKKLVEEIIPLRGRDLEDFMSWYKPSLSFLENASKEDMVLYINECYKKYINLPPEKRGFPKLK